MSKNKNKNNVTLETQVEEVTPVVETETTEEVVETPIEETVVVDESIEEVKEVVEPVSEVEEKKEYEAPAIVETIAPVEEHTTNEVPEVTNNTDPLPELPGHYYVTVGKTLNDNQLKVTHERLDKTGLNYTATAVGEILVGPFVTEREAINAKKLILGKGLKGVIIEL